MHTVARLIVAHRTRHSRNRRLPRLSGLILAGNRRHRPACIGCAPGYGGNFWFTGIWGEHGKHGAPTFTVLRSAERQSLISLSCKPHRKLSGDTWRRAGVVLAPDRRRARMPTSSPLQDCRDRLTAVQDGRRRTPHQCRSSRLTPSSDLRLAQDRFRFCLCLATGLASGDKWGASGQQGLEGAEAGRRRRTEL